MIETLFLFLGLGFSMLVYVRSIRTREDSPARKMLYFFFTLVGITGTIFLIGVMIADMLSGTKPVR